MNGRCFIVTVGTSLLKDRSLAFLDDESFEDLIATSEWQECNDFKARYIEKASPQHSKGIEKLTKELEEYGEELQAKKSAELAALFGKQDQKAVAGDRVVLIATRSLDGAFCALVLCTLLDQFAVALRFPKYLGTADNPDFATRGLPDFLNLCFEIIVEEEKQERQVVLLPNGGYKTLLGYLTLLGLLKGLPVRYVYEESNELLQLPSLPLGLSTPNWLHMRSHFLPYLGHPWESDRLDAYSGIVEKDSAGNAKLTSFGEWLEELYQYLHRSHLQLQTRHTSLLPLMYAPDDIRPEYAECFLRLAEMDSAVWHGERLPDMVDHGARHHYDLFELAERVLLPLFDRVPPGDPPFLAPHELFLLLGALYLHDCGNVVGYLPETGTMKPKVIRKLHSVLGYLRLQRGVDPKPGEPDWCLSEPIWSWLLRDDLKDCGRDWRWPGHDGKKPERQELWEFRLQAIATLGIYHGSSSPLRSIKAGQPLPAELKKIHIPGLIEPDGSIRPLNSVPIKCGTHIVKGDRALILAALLRIIDSLDQQSYRSGPPPMVSAHLRNLDRERAEIDAWLMRTRAVFPPEEAAILEKCSEIPAELIARHAEGPRALLLEEYGLRLAARDFKADQHDHVVDKTVVKQVVVRTQADGGFLRYTIELEYYDNPEEVLRKAEKSIRDAIEREYRDSEIAKILTEDVKASFNFKGKYT